MGLVRLSGVSDYNAISDDELDVLRENLPRFREELGALFGLDRPITQEELADISGQKVDTIRSYEGGKRKPKLAPMMAIARAVRRPVEHLVMRNPPPLDTAGQLGFGFAPKIVGKPPPGFQEELSRLLARFTAEAEQRQDRTHAAKAHGRKGKKI